MEDYPADDASCFASEERRLCRVRGWIDCEPWAERSAPPGSPLVWGAKDRTSLRIAVDSVASSEGEWTPASGRLVVNFPERAAGWLRGDHVVVTGWLSRPGGPSNEGEFDYRDHLLRQHIRATISCESLQSIERAGEPKWSLWRWRDVVVLQARRRLQRLLPEKEAGVAEAALLGTKSAMRRDEIDPYLLSGTLHLLVVSGWHVVVLAIAVKSFGRAVGLRRRSNAVVSLAIVWAYTFLTGFDPPAVRASVLFTFLAGGDVLSLPVQPLNAIAGGGIFVFAVDPMQIEQTGTQLSFLAVLALYLFPRRIGFDAWRNGGESTDTQGWFRRWAAGVATGLLASAAVFAATSPLLAYRFHLFSPSSIWLSVFLAPVVAATIFSTFFLLLLGGTPLAAPIAYFCRLTVRLLSLGADSADWMTGGFCYTAGPPAWWVGGFYLVLLLPWLARRYRRANRWHLAAMTSWCIVGGLTDHFAPSPAGLEVHVLSVGHGNCVVLRTTTNQTILVDCGSISGPSVAERVIAPWLWSQGIQRIDLILLSHADIDHFNCVPALARRFRIGGVYAPPQFAGMDQAAVAYLHNELAKRDEVVQFSWANDRWTFGSTSVRIVHPSARFGGRSDNSNSMVVECNDSGRRMFITGDLEAEGLVHVLHTVRGGCDIVVVPHHGGRASNTPAFAAWASARLAISSQGYRTTGALPVYEGEGGVALRTDREGAVRCRWRKDGIEVSTFRTGRSFWLPDARKGP